MANKNPSLKHIVHRYTCHVRPLSLAEKLELRKRIERSINKAQVPS